MNTIGNKIRDLRRSRGLSQEQLGFEIDVSRQTVSKWEMDAMNPTVDNIKSLCKYFDVAPEYFFDDGTAETPPPVCEQTPTEVTQDNSKSSDSKKGPLPLKIKILYIGLAILFSIMFLLGAFITCFTIYVNSQPSLGYGNVDSLYIDSSIIYFGIGLAVVSLGLLIYIIVLLVKRNKRK